MQVPIDREPYEPPAIVYKIKASDLIKGTNITILIDTPWESDLYINDYKFPPGLEEEYLSYIDQNLKSSMSIRLKLARSLSFFLVSFSYQALHTTVPHLLNNFCSDSNWAIRKVCALQISPLLGKIPLSHHPLQITNFHKLLQDKNLLVKQSACSKLGQFLYNLHVLTEDLISTATDLCKSDLPQISELAYYLPALYRKFAGNRRKIFEMLLLLLENSQSHIRAKAAGTLVFFIQNIEKENSNQLVPIFTNLLRDVDIVKIEAIKSLGGLLQRIDPEYKDNFMGTFRRIQTYNLNWRVNKTIASSLLRIARNISVHLWMQELWRISVVLCHYSAETVRIKAAKTVGHLAKDLWGISAEWDSEIKHDIESMQEENYKIRIALAHILAICIKIKWAEEIFEGLCNDEVINVRAACGIVVNKYDIEKYKEGLRNDEEIDVRDTVGIALVREKDNKLTLLPCRDTDIGNNFVIEFENWDTHEIDRKDIAMSHASLISIT